MARASVQAKQPVVRQHTSTLGVALAAALVFLGVAVAAEESIADTPLPQFSDGMSSVSILDVPGFVGSNGMETVFLCTSLHGGVVDIGVELFDSSGTLLNTVSLDNGAVLGVTPGQTVTFGTSSTATYLETQVIFLPPATTIAQGSARVVASSSQVRCNVMILDKAVTPPVYLATLGEGIQPDAATIPPRRDATDFQRRSGGNTLGGVSGHHQPKRVCPGCRQDGAARSRAGRVDVT